MIGKFEEIALGALIKAGPDANASRVFEVLEMTLEKPPLFAALYTTLDRMVTKKLVSERPEETPGKRTKRLFTITGEGRRAYAEAVNATNAIAAFNPGGAIHA